eukprot:jgi/Picre1/35833/NNA_003293.t1
MAEQFGGAPQHPDTYGQYYQDDGYYYSEHGADASEGYSYEDYYGSGPGGQELYQAEHDGRLREEAVWTGSHHGSLFQHICATMEYYSCVSDHSKESIVQMESLGGGVASLSAGQFSIHMSGGASRMCYLDQVGDLGGFMYQHWNHQVLMGRHGGGVFMYDVTRGREGASYSTQHGVVAMTGPLGSGQVALASPEGHLSVFDPRKGKSLEMVWFQRRADRPVLEPVVRVFDARMGLKAVSTLPFNEGPVALKFHPTLRSTLLVCSAKGMFSLMDTSGVTSTTMETHFIDMRGDMLAACDISASGDCMVFGGTNGYVHLWSASVEPVVATGVVPEYAHPIDRSVVPYIDEDISFSTAPVYPIGLDEYYASSVGQGEVMSVGLPPRVVDASLLASGKVTDLRTGKETEAAIHERASRREKEGGIVIPKKFRRTVIRQQKGTRFEEFDFKAHNTTHFRPLRDFALGHAPEVDKEFTLLDEVSLLFHMLSTSQGEVCQASNLLRALRQTSEAVALGLLEGVKGERGSVDIAVEAQKDKSLVRRIERLCRFIITRMDREEIDNKNASDDRHCIQDIFCLRQKQKTTCLTHKLAPKEQEISTFQLELKYPGDVEISSIQFSTILENSLHTSSEMKAWFDENVRYQPVRQERSPTRLPTVLIAYTGVEDRGLSKFWDFSTIGSFPFAISITFSHVDGSTSVEQADTLEELSEKLGPVPEDHYRDLFLLTGVISYVYDKDEAEEMGKSYEGHLIAHINVPSYYDTFHNLEKSGDLGFTWMTFNDFVISPCAINEIRRTFDAQKVPVLLFFTKVSYLKNVQGKELPAAVSVLSESRFIELCNEPPIQKVAKANLLPKTFVPFTEPDLPNKGDIFALDAEFVAYSAPEKMVLNEQDDWSRTSRLGLGRVSLVRGDGPLAGTPCIDDYIRSVEPVYDHLTRYSGLLPGDLDMEHSQRHLTTLRKAYLKLRYMIDIGCLFVGHGLKKDFKMLNIVVPQDQIIDTMDLYYSGRGRRLSLKFLSSFFLKSSIQGDTHDSIEDAVAALKLYRMHQSLVRENTFDEMLQKAYDWGAVHGWDPAEWSQ